MAKKQSKSEEMKKERKDLMDIWEEVTGKTFLQSITEFVRDLNVPKLDKFNPKKKVTWDVGEWNKSTQQTNGQTTK